jgi:hypothetical protein
MHNGSAHMPARHSFGRNWLSLAITYSKDRKYDGLSHAPQNQDQKARFQLFRYYVGACILIQGPCHNQESIDMLESQCAVLLCSDSAQKVVVDFVEEHDREPLKAELFVLLEQQLLGSVIGDLTVCKKLAILHCDDLTRIMKAIIMLQGEEKPIMKARMTMGQIYVNLPSLLNLAKSEHKLRLVQLDSASHVLWILSLFRDLSVGKRINHDLASIGETAENCMYGGIWVEQMDPMRAALK